MSDIQTAATSSLVPTHQLLTGSLTTLSEQAASQMPQPDLIKRCIRRRRRNENQPAPLPTERRTIEIPEKYKVTDDGRRFLQVDTGGADRILVFASDQGLDLLQQSQHWVCDGTFKSAPTLFFQLYTLHSFWLGQTIACVYALLPGKSEDIYTRLLDQLLELRPGLNPLSVQIDFEIGMRNAVQSSFPAVEISHCHFHLCQSVYRRVQAEGLQQQYNAGEDEIDIHSRMLMALAFLPKEEVADGFVELQEAFPESMKPVLSYFESNYIGKSVRNGRRRQALFPIETWNVCGRTHEGLPRTNNAAEGSHTRLASNITCHHPDLWKLIQSLVREEALSKMRIIQAMTGLEPPVKKQYKDRDARLNTVVERYADNQYDRMGFLRSIAYTIQF